MILTTTIFILTIGAPTMNQIHVDQLQHHKKELAVVQEQTIIIQTDELRQAPVNPLNVTFNGKGVILQFVWKKEKEYGITKAPKV